MTIFHRKIVKNQTSFDNYDHRQVAHTVVNYIPILFFEYLVPIPETSCIIMSDDILNRYEAFVRPLQLKATSQAKATIHKNMKFISLYRSNPSQFSNCN